MNRRLSTTDFLGGGVVRGVLRAVRLAPQRINEDSDTAAGRPQIFNLVRRDPVVDRAAAHADHLARLHDADCLPFHWGCPPKEVSVTATVGLGVHLEENHTLSL